MAILDKAKTATGRARGQAKHGAAVGQARLAEAQARRQHAKLVRQLGEACYAEHAGQGDHESVASAYAALDAHDQAHPPAEVRAGELAQQALVWVEAGAPVGEALHKMETNRIKRLPVIEDHRLVGMITEADLAHNLGPRRLAAFVEKVYNTT